MTQSSRSSTFLALGLPPALLLFYLFVASNPWSRDADTPAASNAEDSTSLNNECSSLISAANYSGALPCVLKLHQAYPGNHNYIEMAADIYDHLGNYDEEAKFWEAYLDRAPNPVNACPRIGQAYAKQDKQKEAIAAYERCLAFDQSNADSIFFLAHALERSGQRQRAAELYERGARLAPAYADLQLGWARSLLWHGRSAASLQVALAVLKNNPDNIDALLVAGLASSQQSQPAQARRYLERGVKLSDHDLDFHLALARLDEQDRDFVDARREYDRILQDHPDDASILAKRNALTVKH